MNHKGTSTIETSRLFLRPFTADDIEPSFRNWTGDSQVTTFLRWPTHPNPEVTAQIIGEWISDYAKPDFYQWAIVLKSLGEAIGTISVVNSNERLNILHIGYCIGSRWWHQGLTTEAFRGIIPYLFEDVGANRIEAWHDPDNPRSGSVMRACGLNYEGTLRQADFSNRGVVDACVYGILRQEWQAANPSA